MTLFESSNSTAWLDWQINTSHHNLSSKKLVFLFSRKSFAWEFISQLGHSSQKTQLWIFSSTQLWIFWRVPKKRDMASTSPKAAKVLPSQQPKLDSVKPSGMKWHQPKLWHHFIFGKLFGIIWRVLKFG